MKIIFEMDLEEKPTNIGIAKALTETHLGTSDLSAISRYLSVYCDEMKVNIGDKVYVPNEKKPYRVRARDDRYIICTKPFNAMHTVLYFIIDLVNKWRAPDKRCKDCKYHHWEQEAEHGKTEYFCSVLKSQVFKDFYCYHGTPKERGGEK